MYPIISSVNGNCDNLITFEAIFGNEHSCKIISYQELAIASQEISFTCLSEESHNNGHQCGDLLTVHHSLSFPGSVIIAEIDCLQQAGFDFLVSQRHGKTFITRIHLSFPHVFRDLPEAGVRYDILT